MKICSLFVERGTDFRLVKPGVSLCIGQEEEPGQLFSPRRQDTHALWIATSLFQRDGNELVTRMRDGKVSRTAHIKRADAIRKDCGRGPVWAFAQSTGDSQAVTVLFFDRRGKRQKYTVADSSGDTCDTTDRWTADATLINGQSIIVKHGGSSDTVITNRNGYLECRAVEKCAA